MSTWKPSEELIDLLTQVAEESISPADHARFEELLRNDAPARAYTLDYLHLHAQLNWNVDDVLPETIGAAEMTPLEDDTLTTAEPGDSSKSLLKVSYWREHRVRFGTLALALTLLFWVGVGWFVFPRFGGNDADPASTSVATITATHGADWTEGATTYELQDSLAAGDLLKLSAGFVEVTFKHGAVVLLEAPVEFTVDTRGAGTLEHGRLVARIEKQAERPEVIPFSITTPLAQIIDMGTEFGVEAGADGTTEVTVFQGRVEATPRGKAKTLHSQPLLLVQGQSARIAPGNDQFDNDAAGEYVRELPRGNSVPVSLTAGNVCHFEDIAGYDGKFRVYSVHRTRQEISFVLFDVSAYYGATAMGPSKMIFTVESGQGMRDEGNFELELRQLNHHNAAMDMNAATSNYLDGTAIPWRSNSGANLENLAYRNSVLDITTALIDSLTGPFGGDTPTTGPAPGTQVVFTIPQSTVQAWLDQTAPPIVVIDAHVGGPPSENGSNLAATVDYIYFGDGTTQPPPYLNLELVDPSDSSQPSP